jgi:DUF1009 family protein
MQPKLGIIAGGGDLPKKVVDSCQLSGRAYHVIAIVGHALPETLEGSPHSWVSISRAGSGFDILKKEEIIEVVMIGDVKVPSFINKWPDYRTFKFFCKSALKFLLGFNGDNSLLLAFASELEKEGIKVIGAHEILNDLLAKEGLVGAVPVPKEFLSDITVGVLAAFDLGKRDAGQAVIVKSGKIIIEEGKAGTAQMIKDSQDIIPDGRGGVLIKLKKPDQDRRMDLPTIGVLTVLEAYEAGIAGIIIQAGETIVIDLESVISTANQKGIFIKALDLN